MKLTSYILDKISWYEYRSYSTDYGTKYYDAITLHFKSWWRRDKTLDIMRISKHDKDSTLVTYYESPEYTELKRQLAVHFHE